jgi:putative ABC transport system ATP-binding protein
MSALLTIENLGKTFGSRTVLADMSFELRAGESVAITGPSGSGKSTLLNIIGLLDRQTAGTVRFGGAPLQSFALIGSSTALENVLIGLHAVRLRRASKEKQILELLDRLGLRHVARDKVATLSGGEQQRVALARCLLKPGELILADEPTGALDDALAEIAVDEMLALQKDYGKSLLVVTHDLRVARRCDRILELGARERASA